MGCVYIIYYHIDDNMIVEVGGLWKQMASVKLSFIFPSSHVPQIKPTKMIIFQTLNPLFLCNEACREEEKNFCAFLPLVKILQGVISSLNEKFSIR